MHRDLKPENLLLDYNKNIKIVDKEEAKVEEFQKEGDNSKKRDLLSRDASKNSLNMLKKIPTPKATNNPFVSTLNELVRKGPKNEYSTQQKGGREKFNIYAQSKISENSEELREVGNEKLVPGFTTSRTHEQQNTEKALPILEKSLRRLKKIEKKKAYISRESSTNRGQQREGNGNEGRQEDLIERSSGSFRNQIGYSWTDRASNFSSNVRTSLGKEHLQSKMLEKENVMKYIAENYDNLKGDLSLLIQNKEKSISR